MNEFFKKPVVKILMLKGEKGDKGNTGTGTPKGGKTGQYLLKKSDADYDYVWSPITTVSWDNVSGKPDATTSASGLMSAKDKSKLDNLQVGGRNYLGEFNKISNNDSKYDALSEGIFIDRTHKNTHDGTPQLQVFKGGTFVKILRSWGNMIGTKQTYIFTIDDTFDRLQFKFNNSNQDSNVTWGVGTLEKGEYIFSFTIAKQSDSGTGYGMTAKYIKLERGNIPTDWAPAPEDLENEIKALNSTTKSFTLSASSWSSGSYTISDSLITATSNQEILPATSITADQMKALQKANIIDSGQSAGNLTLKALGTVPTINIPIRVIFRGTI